MPTVVALLFSCCFIDYETSPGAVQFVGRTRVLLAVHGTGHLRYLVAPIQEPQHRRVRLRYRLGQGDRLAGKLVEAPGLIECIGVVDAGAVLRGGPVRWFVLSAWRFYVVAGDVLL